MADSKVYKLTSDYPRLSRNIEKAFEYFTKFPIKLRGKGKGANFDKLCNYIFNNPPDPINTYQPEEMQYIADNSRCIFNLIKDSIDPGLDDQLKTEQKYKDLDGKSDPRKLWKYLKKHIFTDENEKSILREQYDEKFNTIKQDNLPLDRYYQKLLKMVNVLEFLGAEKSKEDIIHYFVKGLTDKSLSDKLSISNPNYRTSSSPNEVFQELNNLEMSSRRSISSTSQVPIGDNKVSLAALQKANKKLKKKLAAYSKAAGNKTSSKEETFSKPTKSSSSPIETDVVVCSRCGRKNHKSEDCYAKRHFDGHALTDNPPKHKRFKSGGAI